MSVPVSRSPLPFIWLGLTLGLMGRVEAGEMPTSATDKAPPNAAQQAWNAAIAVVRRGPTDVSLNDVSHLDLPKSYGFIPPAEGRRLMEAMDNTTDAGFLGLVVPVDREADSQWLADLEFVDDGHIADDDAREWNAKDLLESLKKGTEEGNQFRAQKGIAPMEITGWVEPPVYDAGTHRLVWSAASRDKGTTEPSNINYNTYVLGRKGYVSLDMITDPGHVMADKAEAKTLLKAVAFKPGQAYADFNDKTDKLAEYGLAALVGGVVLKKAGVIAIAGAFILKFLKVIVVAVLGFGASLRKFFQKTPGAIPDTTDDTRGPGVDLRKD